jgi:spore germination protein KB
MDWQTGSRTNGENRSERGERECWRKGKSLLSKWGIMLLPTVLASGFLILPTTTSQLAHNDLWLTSLPALLVGLLTVYAATRLHELYPKMTVVQ